MPIITYKLFIASSMTNPWRDKINEIVQRINSEINKNRIQIEEVAYGNTLFADGESNDQDTINAKAAECDLFLLLAEVGMLIGEYTMQEYMSAHKKSKISRSSRIVVFVSKSSNQPFEINYVDAETKQLLNFEKRLGDDSGRYVQWVDINKVSFEEVLYKNIKHLVTEGLNVYTQSELSYSHHLFNMGQSVRKVSKYYRRDSLDGELEKIVDRSSILILEGNTYSGKTRAAFELMANKEEWKDSKFYIYDTRYKVEDLNNIELSVVGDESKNCVYLIDDINDIIKDDSEVDYRQSTFWANLEVLYNNYKYKENRHVIITVSGKLSAEEKYKIYKTIFKVSDDNEDFEKYRKSITVNFDTIDRPAFKEMTDQMVRDGVIKRKDVLPGNYTIGSLFIKEETINTQINGLWPLDSPDIECYTDNVNKIILTTIACHFRYARKMKFEGDVNELRYLYKYIVKDVCDPILKDGVKVGVDQLRKIGLIAVFDNRVYIDQRIKRIITVAVEKRLTKNNKTINQLLIGYAQYCKANGSENIDSVAKMGYLICDRNELSDKEIIKLISVVVKATLGDRKKVQIADVIALSQCDNNYNRVFCETAIAKFKDFASVQRYIEMCKSEIYKNEGAESLFKRAVFATLDKNNRTITMVEERTLLEYVFTEDNKWREPFNESDLDDVFNLSRIIPYLQLKAVDIINYIKNATLDGVELSQDGVDDSNNNNVIDSDDQDTGLYDKVFIPRMADAVVTALCKIDSYKEFEEVATVIAEAMDNSANVRTAIKTCFSSKFYYRACDIAKRLSYEDRKKFFDFIVAIPETKTIFGHEDDVNNTKASKIISLNQLLEILDDNDALESFEKMMEASLYDMRTLSHLMKNSLLNFEQLISLVLKYPNQQNHITLNQLMKKAETTSDAHSCMRLMGIKDAKPEKLRDEHALSDYIKIKTVSRERSFSILREWHNLNSNRRLSDIALNPVVKKLSIEDLFAIMDPEDGVEIDCMESYGLLKEEVESMRKNAMFYNMLFYRANTNAKYKERIKKIYERLLDDDKLRPQVIDPENNANNGIISVYIKNRALFDNYDKVKTAVAEIEEKYGDIFRKDDNIYKPLLWWAAEKNKDIDEVNKLLIEAYDYFANYYTRDRVVEMMSKLYHYVPKCLSESDLDAPLKIACEDGLKFDGPENPGTPQKWSNFYEYVKHLSEKDSAYIDGMFIFNTLKLMENDEHNNLYELLANIAHRNREGVKYDAVDKLPPLVQQRLFWVDRENADIRIDRRFCCNILIVKLLWYVVFERNEFGVKQAIDYVVNNNIPITQTLLNMLFKIIERGKSADGKKFNQIVNLLDSIANRTELFHHSVQMCISLIAVASNEQELEDIFTTHGFDQLCDRTEVIGARINRLINLRNSKRKDDTDTSKIFNSIAELKADILKYKEQVNISVINAYIHALFMVCLGDLLDEKLSPAEAKEILSDCWPTVRDQRVIDINRLLQIGGDNNEAWSMYVDVQTLSYFVDQCDGKRLISMIDKMFNKDFYYDENKRKSCLKDAVKNYSRVGYDTSEEHEAEVDYIVEVLLREENSDVCEDLCKRYVYREYWVNNCVERKYRGYVGNKKVFSFWKAALCNQRFKDYIKSKGVQFYEDDSMV